MEDLEKIYLKQQGKTYSKNKIEKVVQSNITIKLSQYNTFIYFQLFNPIAII